MQNVIERKKRFIISMIEQSYAKIDSYYLPKLAGYQKFKGGFVSGINKLVATIKTTRKYVSN
jgi:hypothetical protein